MPTSITTLVGGDGITTANSMTKINANFDSLNTNKLETNLLTTTSDLSENSDLLIPSQKAVKNYVDSGGNQNASETTRGIVQEATDAQVTAGTATGSTGAKLFVTPAKLATKSTSGISAGPTSSSTQTITHGLGRTPTIIRIKGYSYFKDASKTPGFSDGIYNNSGNKCVYFTNETGYSAPITSSVFAIKIYSNSQNASGIIQNLTSTTFDIVWTATGSLGTDETQFLWETQ
jgi:hypothetical protein